MQPVLTQASESQFIESNGEFNGDTKSAMAGWALVMGIAIVSFLVHVHPNEGIAAEQAAQGLLVMGAAAVLAHGSAMRLADGTSGAGVGTNPAPVAF